MHDPYKNFSVKWWGYVFILYIKNVSKGFVRLVINFFTGHWYASAVSLDKFCNALICGDPNETMSSRFGREGSSCKPCYWICMFLNLFQHDHCKKALDPKKDHKHEIVDL